MENIFITASVFIAIFVFIKLTTRKQTPASEKVHFKDYGSLEVISSKERAQIYMPEKNK